MDFLDPRKKRAHNIRLYIGYALMAVALGISTVILVFAAYGYDIDRSTGDIIQNGLIIVDAHPESATIFVNGEGKGTTDNRLILPAGQYKVELQREGYHNWVHDVSLEGSSIEQLVYPFLFPADLSQRGVLEYATIPSLATASLDRRWLIMNQPNSDNSFQVVDMNTPAAAVATIALPAGTITAAPGSHVFEPIEWSSDNTNVLLKHNFTGGSEYVMLNRGAPANSINLTKKFAAQPFTSISLRDKKPDQFYLHNAADGGLYQANGSNSAATLVRSGVGVFKPYQDDTILYSTASSDQSLAEIRIRRGNQDVLVRSLPAAASYLLDIAEFKGDLYAVAGSLSDGRTYVYKNPLNDISRLPGSQPKAYRVLVQPGAQYLSFSAIARFIAVQSGGSFTVYDLETSRQFKYDTRLPAELAQKASWMDGHRLALVSGNSVNVFDFDGTNLHKLTSSHTVFPAFFNRDYSALFTLAPSADKTSILRTELLSTADRE